MQLLSCSPFSLLCPTLRSPVLPLFALAAFAAAALLFLVQPMMGKALLPHAGGSPGVWTTCMLFFQGALLVGYSLAHLVTNRLRPSAQVAALGVLFAGAIALSIRGSVLRGVEINPPELWVLVSLGFSVALPFIAVSTASPLLQRWFSATSHPRAADPYFLSIASNAGSAVGLLAYPLVMERYLPTTAQWKVWVVGLAGVGLLLVAAGFAALRARAAAPDGVSAATEHSGSNTLDGAQPVTNARRLHWLILAMVPSSLMLGVTQHISTDIAAVPLLWAGPLLIYLVSFMVAFAGTWAQPARRWGRALPLLMLPLAAAMLLRARTPAGVLIFMHMAALFIAATMCHRRLAELRPPTHRLTEFYFFLSLGGVLGGVFNALIAPHVFTTVLEYPLMLGVACLLRPQTREEWQPLSRWSLLGFACVGACVAVAWLAPQIGARWFDPQDERIEFQLVAVGAPMVLLSIMPLADGALRFAVAFAAVLVLSASQNPYGDTLARERTFFGVHTVAQTPSMHQLLHGTTLHGLQARQDTGSASLQAMRTIPGTYYHPSGPIGDVIAQLKKTDRFHRAGFVGLGAGTMAAYGQQGTTIRFYEIDPAVARFAQDPNLFTFVADARARGATVDIVLGDGRLGIAHELDGSLDLIAIDAFSSDAIPVHLITREAVQLFMRKVGPHGVVAFHVSNRSFLLPPVLVAIAQDLHLKVTVRSDSIVTHEQAEEGKIESDWVLLAREWDDMGGIAHSAMWERPVPGDEGYTFTGTLWTDDRSDVLSVFRGW